jgi:hypothetical protein
VPGVYESQSDCRRSTELGTASTSGRTGTKSSWGRAASQPAARKDGARMKSVRQAHVQRISICFTRGCECTTLTVAAMSTQPSGCADR